MVVYARIVMVRKYGYFSPLCYSEYVYQYHAN